jgi:hypothetical protein
VVDFPNALWLADFVSESNVISITYVFAVLFWPARQHPFVTTREFLPPRFLLPDAFAAEATWKQECAISEKKTFRANAVKGGGAPTGPPRGAGVDRDPPETQPVKKTYGISKVKIPLHRSSD